MVHGLVLLDGGRTFLGVLDVVGQATDAYCPYTHDGDGSSGPESDDGVAVFHEVGEDLEATDRETMEFLACVLGSPDGEAVEFGAEVFVLEPTVEGGLADAGPWAARVMLGAAARMGRTRVWQRVRCDIGGFVSFCIE